MGKIRCFGEEMSILEGKTQKQKITLSKNTGGKIREEEKMDGREKTGIGVIKRPILLSCICLLCLWLIGVGRQFLLKETTLSDEEVVTALLEAFKAGDYEGLKPYIDKDNPLHLYFANQKEETLSAVYQAAQEQLKNITYTVKVLEGAKIKGTIQVTISMPNYEKALYMARTEALADQVVNGTDAFENMPAWLSKAFAGEGEVKEKTFDLYVGSKDGSMVLDSNTNRKFFEMLCGGLKQYLKGSITTCTFPNGDIWLLFAQGDEIAAMLNRSTVDVSGKEQEWIDETIVQFEENYNEMGGFVAHAECSEEKLFTACYGIEMEEASSYELEQIGLISGNIAATPNSWLSLKATIKGFTGQGAECVTETFKAETEEKK